MQSSLPGGLVTLLFTDIEGSTQMWERYPEAMKPALARHDDLIHCALATHGGQVVKTTGDGVFAVFPSAKDAVRSVVAAQVLLQAEPWEGISPLRVRMALHTAEVEMVHGDYYGPAVNRAARLMALASGGQVLVSQAIFDLTGGDFPEGISLRDLGEHRLKDLSRPERVFQVLSSDLPSEFPALQSIDAFPNNLPVQLSSFIGRELEMEQVGQLMSTTRLLTLTGSGGTGKTRLLLQAAAEALRNYRDGAWLIELASVVDPALVLPTISAVLKVREQPDRSLLDVLSDFLRARNLLLVLDNCEHLIVACADIAEKVLRACPRLHILASSREALGITGETTFLVPSLSTPTLKQSHSAEALIQFDAARLFIERAQAAVPGFQVTDTQAPDLAQICQRLDGIPLAIELAAARVKVLTLNQLARRLDDRFRLLTGGSRSALPRQQTLRALIDWSYDLLPPEEQKSLRRLSVFAGGWTLEAAEAVVVDIGDSNDMVEMLAQLTNKSLVIAEQARERDMRYHLLETIRQYAREKMFDSGEGEMLRDRHLAYYLRAAEAIEYMNLSPKQAEWMDWCETEQDNCRAAIDWGMGRDAEAALRLVAGVNEGWLRRGYTSDTQQLLQSAIDRVEALPGVAGEPGFGLLSILAKTWGALGSTFISQGMNLQAHACFERSLSLYAQIGNHSEQARSVCMLGFTEVLLGNNAEGEKHLVEAETLARRSGDKVGLGMALGIQANFMIFSLNDPVKSRRYNAEALQLAREIGAPWILGQTILGNARIAAVEGRVEDARSQFTEAAAIYQGLGDSFFVNVAQSEIAHLERRQGNFDQARRLYKTTIRHWLELGQVGAIANQLECFAFLNIASGDYLNAVRLFGAAESFRERLESKMTVPERLEYESQVAFLRTHMGDVAFTEGWSEGRILNKDEAISYAIR